MKTSERVARLRGHKAFRFAYIAVIAMNVVLSLISLHIIYTLTK